MHIYENKKYLSEIEEFSKTIDLSSFDNKTFLIAGACGLVMSYLIDVLLSDKNKKIKVICIIYSERDKTRFEGNDSRLSFLQGDVRDPSLFSSLNEKIDYVINGASIVDPKGYKERPIDTMLINIYGTKNLLDVASKNNASFLLASSCEIYGDSDVDLMPEDYCGKLNPMDVRSCYNESKRACETLSVCYSVENNIRCLVARLSRTFGPTQSPFDTKALSQFMKNAILGQDIVLKSDGKQLFSYTYVQDVVRGLIIILQKGTSRNAYNVCNREVHTLKDIAKMCASFDKKKIICDLKDDGMKNSGYSKANLAIQDPSKLEELGYRALVSLEEGIANTISILKETYYS